MLLFLLLTIIICSSSYFITSLLFYKQRSVDFVIHWAVIFIAQIVVVDLILGINSLLYLSNILYFHLLICLVTFFAYKRKKHFVIPTFDLKFILDNKLLLLALSFFIGFFAVKFWINLINPPICPDSLQYHLSFPATWIRNGTIENPIVGFGPKDHLANFIAMTYYPMSVEFYFHWLIVALRNAFLADVGEAPFYFLGILAIYSIFRKFNMKKKLSLLLAFLWVLIPNLFKQIEAGSQVDVICAAFFLIVLNVILIIKESPEMKNFLLFGIVSGLFISIKATNIFWLLSLMPLFLCIVFSQGITSKWIKILVLFIPVIGIGGYSYINNFILTKNLFYPITFEFLGKVIMPGIIDKKTFAYLLYYWEEFSLRKVLFSEGFGVQLFAFILPGSFIPLLSLPFLKKRFNGSNFKIYLTIFLAPLFIIILYFFYIKAFWIRYFFPYFGIGLISAGLFLDRFAWKEKYIYIAGTICILASVAEFSGHLELIVSLCLSSLLFLVFINIRRHIPRSNSRVLNWRLLLSLSILAFSILSLLNIKYNHEEARRYPLLFSKNESSDRDIGFAWQWIHETSKHGGRRIAYTGRGEFYPLFGPQLINDVFHVATDDQPPKDNDYKKGVNRPGIDEKEWLRRIKESAAQLLVVYQPHQDNKFPIEDIWVCRNSDKFKLVFENSKVRIYSVLAD